VNAYSPNEAPNVSLFALWLSIFSGPLAWAVDEVVAYSITSHACSTGTVRTLYGLTIAALALCAIGLVSGLRELRAMTSEGSMERHRSMARAGIALSLTFGLAVLATAIPKLMLSPCD
jgi:hypothetical protein